MKRSVIILLHLGYWILFLLLLSLLIIFLSIPSLNKGRSIPFDEVFTFLTPFAIIPGVIGFYSFYSFLYSRYFAQKKIIGLFLIGVLISITSGLIGAVGMTILFFYHQGPGIFHGGLGSAIALTNVMSFGALMNGIIGLVMKGFITSYGDIKLKEDLNKKNYEIELELIKSHINPHFLFNTINNIDVLIGIDPSKASAYLNKLSDIMRFMLYETKTEVIPLKKELTYIEKYIDLQKIRTSNLSYVNYVLEGNAADLTIAPILFIPFMENAFKYAENKKIENAITIRIVIEKDKITFECKNNYGDVSRVKPDQGGLGNELIQKRLMLLYPNKHTLEITSENNNYKVKLILHGNAN